MVCDINRNKNLCGKCENCVKRLFLNGPLRKFSHKTDKELSNIMKFSKQKDLFICPQCKKSWFMMYRTFSLRKMGCNNCFGNHEGIGNNFKINKSFLESENRYLSKLLDEELKKISISSRKIGIFYCNRCPHAWKTSYNSISNGSKCPYCCKYGGKLCKDQKCKWCFDHSFLSSKYRNICTWKDEDLRKIKLNSQKKGDFKCLKCNHKWKTTFRHVNEGQGCGKCSKINNKTQIIVYDFLKEKFPKAKIYYEKKFEWGGRSSFDVVINNYIVEIDGPQHFHKLEFFNKNQSFEEIQRKDIEKIILANNNGYNVIRFSQEDILKNRFSWQEFLLSALTMDVKLSFWSTNIENYKYLIDRLQVNDGRINP